MKRSIMIGLFTGVTMSSLILLMLKFVRLTYSLLVAILYLYPIVGGLTGFFVYKRIVKKGENSVSNLNKSFDIKVNPDIANETDTGVSKELVSLVKIIKNGIRIQNKIEDLRKENKQLIQSAMEKLERKIKTLS